MNYIKITTNDIANGPGVRTVLWVSGCDHKCPGCQNPSTWETSVGQKFDAAARQKIFWSLNNPYQAGLTLSGGDPLLYENRAELTSLAKEVRKQFPDKTIWCYTGYLWENVHVLEIMRYIDVLVDGPFVERLYDISLRWRGSSNQRIIDVQKSLRYDTPVIADYI